MARMPSLVSLPAPVYFLSDAHLGAVRTPDPRQQRQKFDQFIQIVSGQARTLVLVGDLFDFWYEWRRVIPKRYFHELHALRGVADKGIGIHYLAGNHDFRLKGFLESEIGMQVYSDTLSAEISGRPTFVFHGDGILKRDHGYRLVKRILRNRAAQWAFGWIHPDCALKIASGTSVTSRALIKENPADDVEFLAYARGKFDEGYELVVMGHSHRPVEHHENHRTYVNLGDWITRYTYGLHDGSRLSLQRLDS
jgi:UDP-2,3-diacylglucosamine hydrolase